MRGALVVLPLVLWGCSHPPAPAPPFDEVRVREIVETRSYTAGTPKSIEVTADGSRILYLRTGPRDDVGALYVFDVASGESRRIAGLNEEALTAEESARRERQRITSTGIAWYRRSDDGRLALIPKEGVTVVDVATGASRAVPGALGAVDPRFSPDGRFVAFVKDHDLHVADLEAGTSRALTRGGTEALHHGAAEFVAQEEMSRTSGYVWSPDSRWLLYQETDERAVEVFHVADPADPAKPPRTFRYPRAGRANASVRVGLLAVTGGPTRWIPWDRERFPYLARMLWSENAPPSLLVQSRDQKEELFLAIDPATGATRELLRERDEAWLNLHDGVPRWLPDGSGFLWISESDGEMRLQLRRADGSLERVLNPGSGFRLRSLEHVDTARRVAIVKGSDDPKTDHLWELPLDGGSPKALTSGRGVHDGAFASRAPIYAVTAQSLLAPPVVSVRRADGEVVGTLPSEGVPLPAPPNVELLNVAGLEAAVVRPRDFAPGRKLPVLVWAYGGPSAGEVRDSLGDSEFVRLQAAADRGYLVFTADPHGLSNRGRAFERAIRGDFATTLLDDQVRALEEAARRVPEMDLTRVGIYGWSFGGYTTALAVCARGDVFHAGVSGAPVVDWLDYDTHYTERYLGLPSENPDGYRRSSVLTYAPKLERPLLIVHGTGDDNVYFLNSLKLADALFHLGRPAELVPVANATHLLRRKSESAVALERATARFFDEHVRDRR